MRVTHKGPYASPVKVCYRGRLVSPYWAAWALAGLWLNSAKRSGTWSR